MPSEATVKRSLLAPPRSTAAPPRPAPSQDGHTPAESHTGVPTTEGGLPIYRPSVYTDGVLREPTFLILAAVAPAPLHGYGILQAVEELSQGRVRLRPGTLYAALDRLVGEGSLAVDREEVVESRLRRYYQITEGGLEVLRRGVEQLEANVTAARGQLALRADGGLA
jgi:DNA-binding PadR family transcriptional regulator